MQNVADCVHFTKRKRNARRESQTITLSPVDAVRFLALLHLWIESNYIFLFIQIKSEANRLMNIEQQRTDGRKRWKQRERTNKNLEHSSFFLNRSHACVLSHFVLSVRSDNSKKSTEKRKIKIKENSIALCGAQDKSTES